MYALLSLMLTEAATHLVRDSAHTALLSETASIQRCLLPKRNGFPSFALNLNGISEIIETFSHSNKPLISPCEGPPRLAHQYKAVLPVPLCVSMQTPLDRTPK